MEFKTPNGNSYWATQGKLCLKLGGGYMDKQRGRYVGCLPATHWGLKIYVKGVLVLVLVKVNHNMKAFLATISAFVNQELDNNGRKWEKFTKKWSQAVFE